MSERTRQGTSNCASPVDGPVRPGALTALLADLARAPERAGWELPAVPGETIGRFEIVRELGRGGFGVVYEARDVELGRSVAFKAVRAGSSDAAREQRALAEAEAAARLAHPNIVHLYDVGRCDRGPFLIMELLRGETLDGRLGRGPLPVREAVRIAVEIARGVAHAHAQGVVHRDLKPGNVFVCDDGQVKVLDFGLAHVFGRESVAGGTPAYMAPEQVAGEAGDERADVYALGVIVHELVTGQRPSGKEPGLAGGEKPPELRGAPTALGRLVASMLARDPAARPASAVEARDQLAAVQRSMEPKRLLWAGLSVAAVALAGAGLFAWLWQRPIPPGPLLTALADAENATGDPELDVVSELLRTGLEQSRRFSVMARSRLVNVLRDARGAVPRTIGEREARAVAERTRASLVVAPAVRQAGGEYEVEARVVSVDRGQLVVVARERARTKPFVPAALDRVTARIRAALHETPEDVLGPAVRISDAAPSNGEAWRHYFEWRRLMSEGADGAEVDAAFQRLLAADPEFPVARTFQALAASEHDLDEAMRHIEAALRNVGRVPPKERAMVEAIAVPFRGGSQLERMQRLDALVARWPEEPWGHVWAANILMHQYADLAAARPYLERALEVAPLGREIRIHFLVALGRLDEALARARQFAEERPGPHSLAVLASVHRWRGEPQQALEAVRRSVALAGTSLTVEQRWAFLEADALEELDAAPRRPADGEPEAWTAAHGLALRGRWHEALAALQAVAPPASASDGVRAEHGARRAELLAFGFGDADAVWREVVAGFGRASLGANVAGTAPFTLAAVGDTARARFLLLQGPHEGSGLYRAYDAFERWSRGDLEGALRGFEGTFGLGSGFYRGQVLAELGRDREAVEGFRRYRRLVDVPWGDTFYDPFMTAANYPRSLLLEAASLERLGERDEALRVVDRLLRLWRSADPDLADLAKAKALRHRLATGR